MKRSELGVSSSVFTGESGQIDLQPAQNTLLDGIQLAWHFDDDFDINNRVYDEVVNAAYEEQFTATTDPGITANGKFNKCISWVIGGFGANPVACNNQYLHLSGARTYSFWLYQLEGGNNNQQFLGIWFIGDDAQAEWVVFSDGTGILQFGISDTINGNQFVGLSIDSAVWVHFVVTYDGAGTMKVYKNSVLAGTNVSASVNLLPLVANLIGSDTSGSIGGADDNRVDELNVWNRVLTQTEINQLYNGGAGNPYPFA